VDFGISTDRLKRESASSADEGSGFLKEEEKMGMDVGMGNSTGRLSSGSRPAAPGMALRREVWKRERGWIQVWSAGGEVLAPVPAPSPLLPSSSTHKTKIHLEKKALSGAVLREAVH
jgi:hypothetical protein